MSTDSEKKIDSVREPLIYIRIMEAFKDRFGFTRQTQVAEKLKVSKQVVQAWKTGKSSPIKYIPRICEITGWPVDRFLEQEPAKEKTDQLIEDVVFRYKKLDDETRNLFKPTLEMIKREFEFRLKETEKSKKPYLAAAAKHRLKRKDKDAEERDEQRGIKQVEDWEQDENE